MGEWKWPPLWSSFQSSFIQIQRSGFDSRHYHMFWEVVGLERGPLSLVNTTEELLERKSSGFGLENREYGRRDSSRWSCGTLYPQKLTLSSPTSGRSLGRYSSLADSGHGVWFGFLGGSGGIAPSFLSSALDGSEWPASRSCHFFPAERAYSLDRRPRRHQVSVWTYGGNKYLDTTGIRTSSIYRISNPSLYGLSYLSFCGDESSDEKLEATPPIQFRNAHVQTNLYFHISPYGNTICENHTFSLLLSS
jgi:hypothetical protein